ncbi:hypothetical protein N7519_000045 [Penicillium mononematosum]|uniref:uncharacterized protein n=1 Tax=Penicillium mononematosum TaxID=268346 RepID=UPI002547B719|nr:uncharacterized protein N7519_000045 [Penicillium mononematosum]KAJ6190024.1 hypothetical protein N7519_000045 [Penicillium mononematosum]
MEKATEEPTNGPPRVTIDEMLERYPRRRAKVIRQFEQQIDQGVNVESCREGIQWALENMSPTRPFDPAEPQDLHPDVLWRIQFLKYMYLDGDDVDEEEWVNYHAVLNAYRSGRFDMDPEKVTVWFAGELKLRPFPRRDLNEVAISMQISEWRAELGHGRVWIEDFSLSVRLIGATDFISIDNVLDDTGSAPLEIFRDDAAHLASPQPSPTGDHPFS